MNRVDQAPPVPDGPTLPEAPLFSPKGGQFDPSKSAGNQVRIDHPNGPQSPGVRSIEQTTGALVNIFA